MSDEQRISDLLAANNRYLERARVAEARADLAEAAVAWANNSLFGSHGFFLSLNGGEPDPLHLADGIENLKAQCRAKAEK